MNRRGWILNCIVLLGALAALGIAPTARAQKDTRFPDEFFIISSVNQSKDHLILKRPTEVTVQMRVDPKTVIVDSSGKKQKVDDLRAGDTVFIEYVEEKGGEFYATHIRRAPMTLQALHARYLNY